MPVSHHAYSGKSSKPCSRIFCSQIINHAQRQECQAFSVLGLAQSSHFRLYQTSPQASHRDKVGTQEDRRQNDEPSADSGRRLIDYSTFCSTQTIPPHRLSTLPPATRDSHPAKQCIDSAVRRLRATFRERRHCRTTVTGGIAGTHPKEHIILRNW
jgi:hypothetical protein